MWWRYIHRFVFQPRCDSRGNHTRTMVAGIPDSGAGKWRIRRISGTFFSGGNVDEAILQSEFAKDLSDQPSSLIGKDLVLRYCGTASAGNAGCWSPQFVSGRK